MNYKELAENLELEEDEFFEMVELFLEASTSDLSRLESAIIEENAEKVMEAAHSIKGASGNMGFMDIFVVAREVEKRARDNGLEGIAESAQELKKKLDEIAVLAADIGHPNMKG